MLKNWSNKKIIIVLLFFTILSGIIFLPIIYSLSDKLSKTTRVDANILLVEGWINPFLFDNVMSEFTQSGYAKIITTGLRSTPDYFNIFSNGYLIFYTELRNPEGYDTSGHTIQVKASGSLNGIERAAFNVLTNDSIAGNFKADKKKKKYTVHWSGKLVEIDSVSIQFTNDRVSKAGDRNLFIKEIIIDHNILIPYQKNSIYYIGKPGSKNLIKNNYDSYADLTRNNLISLGLDSSAITAIPAKRVRINRTLSSALAVRNWLKTSDIEVTGINIVTIGAHAKRTFMTYNKLFGEKYAIGIISLPDYRANYSRRYKVFKTLRETIGIVYYWIILLPY